MNAEYLAEFVKASLITSAWLLPVILGLVTYWGKLGVTGKWQLVSSMATGLVIGGIVMFAQVQPANLIQWLAVAAYGIIMGLTASGVYDTAKEVMVKSERR